MVGPTRTSPRTRAGCRRAVSATIWQLAECPSRTTWPAGGEAEVLEAPGEAVGLRGLQGLDSLLSIVQMPGGVPVGTLAIGKAGATNAGLLAVGILATSRPELQERLRQFRAEQTAKVRQDTLP